MKHEKEADIRAKKWIKTLNEAGIRLIVCKGCDAAIEFIKSITWGFMTEVERLLDKTVNDS